MKFTGVELAQVFYKFAVTDTELDQLSLALSICEVTPKTPEETAAVTTLSKFSELLNELLARREGK